MPVDRTEIDGVLELVESADTAVGAAIPADMEDTFRNGPPGSLPSKFASNDTIVDPEELEEDERDTGEMAAAVEDDDLEALDPEDLLEDAGPTTKLPRPKTKAKTKMRVVERVRGQPRARIAEPVAPVVHATPHARGLAILPSASTAAAAPLTLPSPNPVAAPSAPVAPVAHAPVAHAPAKAEVHSVAKYDVFSVEDPPVVGVDPAVFPIHRTAPNRYLGQKIILAMVGMLMAMILTGFVVGGESAQEREMRRAVEARNEMARMAVTKIEARRHQRELAAAAEPRPVGAPIDRAARVHRPLKLPGRARPRAMIQPAVTAPYVFLDGKVAQPQSYGGRDESMVPVGTGPMLIVMSQPAALVFKGSKLFGATPMLVPVSADTQSVTVTLRTFGYVDKTIDVRPAASGNLEASVVLDKDPAFENFKVTKTEKPRS